MSGARLFNLPNVLSMLRLPIAAVFFAVDGLLLRGILLSLGALTDALDGWLARHFAQESDAGALLDPLFDKLFVLVALAAFLSGPYLGWTEFAVLISRDLYVGVLFLAGRLVGLSVSIRSRPTGKVVTVLQMATLFILLLAPERIEAFTVAVGVASLLAIVDYTVAGIAGLRRRRS